MRWGGGQGAARVLGIPLKGPTHGLICWRTHLLWAPVLGRSSKVPGTQKNYIVWLQVRAGRLVLSAILLLFEHSSHGGSRRGHCFIVKPSQLGGWHHGFFAELSPSQTAGTAWLQIWASIKLPTTGNFPQTCPTRFTSIPEPLSVTVTHKWLASAHTVDFLKISQSSQTPNEKHLASACSTSS